MTSVEVAAISSIVSVTLKNVGNKLAPLLIRTYSSIVGVKEDIEELHGLILEINDWMETIASNANASRVSFAWLQKLKDISYDVDDVVDEFQLKAEKHDAVGDGGTMSKYLSTIPKSFVFQCKAANKIKAIKKRFAAIVKQRTDYRAITNSLSVGPLVQPTNMRTNEIPALLPNVDEALVVGRDKDKQKIISMLEENDDQQKIKIVSVIGLGGSGKTTLAKLVFNDGNIMERHLFEVRLWVHVSKEFVVNDLIKKLFEAFCDNNPGTHALPYMNKAISNKLKGKRFLLVLDDVWTNSRDEWEEFMVCLKVGAPQSRILLTTRNREVSVIVGSTKQFHLPFLSLDDSWQLFQQSLVTRPIGWGFEFEDVGKAIVHKCGGVPLAIKVLAGALHGKERIEEWQEVRDKNLLNVDAKQDKVVACLRLSYFHLPLNLKQCFTICSVFPKGHRIDKEELIDLWIAHDMITIEDGVYCLDLEYVGYKHFESLLKVYFLQNFEEEDGRVTYGMHDLVHDLALSILGDEISLEVPNEEPNLRKGYRYFSLIEGTKCLVPKNIFRKARAIYMPKSEDCIYGMALKHAKHLRSIRVRYLNEEGANTISHVKYLKYLTISELSCETLPKAISDVWSLQALHVRYSYSLQELPQTIGKLKLLRTLRLSDCKNLKSLPESIGDCQMISSIDLCNCEKLTVLPDSIGKLQKLRKLNLSRCRELKCLPDTIGDSPMISSIDLCNCQEFIVLPDSIGRNQKLRGLRLSFTKIERLPSSIKTLRNLEYLDLQGCGELVELPEGTGNLDKLHVLNLEYCEKLGGMPVGIGQLSRLQKLIFVVGKGEKFARISELANVSRISEDVKIRGIAHVTDPNDAHMACLKQNAHLQRLVLEWMADDMEDVINAELQQDVLDGLEPPPGIKELDIHGYSGRQYAPWMLNQVGGGVQGTARFPFLRVMSLHGFLFLEHLDGLMELPCLEELQLEWMPSLETLSGGPFPSLVKLEMNELPCLGEVWMVVEGEIPDGEDGGCCCNFTPHLGQVRVGNFLTELKISNCPKLKVKPHLPPSLQQLELRGSAQLVESPGQCQGSSSSPTFSHLKKIQLCQVTGLGPGNGWELLQHTAALESLQIDGFRGPWRRGNFLTELPESLCSLTSLLSLRVYSCSSIHLLPESIGELRSLQELTIKSCDSLSSLPQSMGHLTSLQELIIEYCDALQELPDCLGELCSLRKLEIKYLQGLTCLPQSISHLTTSLLELKIDGCPGIKSLPEWIKDLRALKRLSILRCQHLNRRCEKGTGEDWHLISHIPDVYMF